MKAFQTTFICIRGNFHNAEKCCWIHWLAIILIGSMTFLWIIQRPDWDSHVFYTQLVRKSNKLLGKNFLVFFGHNLHLVIHKFISNFATFSEYKGYSIFLDIEVFGYEDLLYELAHNHIKIGLCKIQESVFKYGGQYEKFKYDGVPDIKVWARFKDEVAIKPHQYIRCVLNFQ